MRMKNLSIGKKLWIGFGTVLLLLLGTAVTSLTGSEK